MLDRITRGSVPPRPHTVVKALDGGVLYEECLTRDGFDGPFSILYHRYRPHEALPSDGVTHGFRTPPTTTPAWDGLLRRHYRCLDLAAPGGAPVDCRIPVLHNGDVTIGFARPTTPDPVYFVNGDGDDLFFILRGAGTLRSVLGDLRFGPGDYVGVPKGVLHRFVPDAAVPQAWLSIECKRGLGLPRGYRNQLGQLRMDAPYSHRDFRRPELEGQGEADGEAMPDEGIRDLVVKRGDRFFPFRTRHPPLDVVGWDGTVYPFALPISAFRPRVGQLHLPPPVHATFEAGGALICSFVPRPLDFDPAANPCPYPHASVDVDEVLFYANGAFGSRRGVGEGSLSHHPAGIAHGPHPGAYESAPGQTHTDELAVMLDCAAPLFPTAEARAVEDGAYHASFVDDRR